MKPNRRKKELLDHGKVYIFFLAENYQKRGGVGMSSALFVNLDTVSLREIMELAASNEYSVATTPFGGYGVRTYIRRAAPWKGVTKAPDETLDDFVNRIAQYTKKGTFEGLKKAVAVSKEAAGADGVGLVQLEDGSYSIMPVKAYKQMIATDKKVKLIASAKHYKALMKRPEVAEMVRARKALPVIA